MSIRTQNALLIPSKACGYVQLGTRPVPIPGRGQLLVKIQSAALNPVDHYVKDHGIFVDKCGFPALIGYDGAGIIEQVADDVQGWNKGDRVLFQGDSHPDFCTFQQYALCDAVVCTKIPEKMSFDDASTFPVALGTAAVGLYQKLAPVSGQDGGAGLIAPWESGIGKYAGQPALVFGGSSSVGQLAIQLVKLSGFNPIIATASKKNENYCKAAGATHVIDYHDLPYADLPAAVAKLVNGPISLVYDAVSSEDSQKAGWAILAHSGSLINAGRRILGITPDQIGEDGKHLVQVWGVIRRDDNIELGAKMCNHLTDLLEEGLLKPNNVEVLPGGLAGVSAGLDRLLKGVSAVKLVVRPQETT
ncbi:GroES-like protein [Amylostereum chailletii]|nr:GroES-like protein [Amylostereum chailletii]